MPVKDGFVRRQRLEKLDEAGQPIVVDFAASYGVVQTRTFVRHQVEVPINTGIRVSEALKYLYISSSAKSCEIAIVEREHCGNMDIAIF